MSQTPAGERLRRVLAMVPWIVSNPGVPVAEVAERFNVPEDELIKDLHVVWMVGLPPYTPDALVEVVMEEGRVWIHYADFFARPLRLTPAQGLAMLASSDGLLSLPGTDPEGPLARALPKLARALGIELDEALDVDLGAAGSEHLEALRDAITNGTEVQITYFSYARDELTERRIAPWRLTANGGAWYVEGWCNRAEGERIFRLDRIDSLSSTDDVSDHQRPTSDHSYDAGSAIGEVVFKADEAHARVTLLLSPAASWVVDSYPCEEIVRHDDGSITATLAVSTRQWLERLLLRLGPDVSIVEDSSFDNANQIAASAACRVLSRYQR